MAKVQDGPFQNELRIALAKLAGDSAWLQSRSKVQLSAYTVYTVAIMQGRRAAQLFRPNRPAHSRVEEEMQHVAILDDIGLTLGTHLACVLGCLFPTKADKVIISNCF